MVYKWGGKDNSQRPAEIDDSTPDRIEEGSNESTNLDASADPLFSLFGTYISLFADLSLA